MIAPLGIVGHVAAMMRYHHSYDGCFLLASLPPQVPPAPAGRVVAAAGPGSTRAARPWPPGGCGA